MPAEFSLDMLAQRFIDSLKTEGAFGDDVLVQFICNTGPGGEHDPTAEPDDRVRPSHSAYHGKIFKMGEAPVPPLDYGCRCALRYIARPKTAAAEVIETTSDEPSVIPAVATAQWLDTNVENWRRIATNVNRAGVKDSMQTAFQQLSDDDVPQARSIAEMIIDVVRNKIL